LVISSQFQKIFVTERKKEKETKKKINSMKWS